MIRLLKIELQKIIYSRQLWIILGLYILLIIPVAYAIDSVSLGGSSNGEAMPGGMAINFFNFPAVWHNMAYLFTWFQLFLGIIIISLVTTEFSQRTLRQNIIDGLTKWEIIWSKELVIILLSSISTLLLVAFTLIFGNQGPDTSLWTGSGSGFNVWVTDGGSDTTLVKYFRPFEYLNTLSPSPLLESDQQSFLKGQ